jgi:hypothetical protein
LPGKWGGFWTVSIVKIDEAAPFGIGYGFINPCVRVSGAEWEEKPV